MSRQSRFEIVHSDAGWFARFIASNGREVWRTSETYERKRAARHAVALIGDAPRYSDGRDADLIEVRTLDERACSCGSRETTSLNPAEVVVHRVGKPCYITARDERTP